MSSEPSSPEGMRLKAATQELREARAAVKAAVRRDVLERGESEAGTARKHGVTRVTVRQWIGKDT